MKGEKKMKKKSIIIIATLMLMLGGNAKAQIFIMNEEEYTNERVKGQVGGGLPIVPIQDVTTDQYAPLGGGTLLLGLLGGAYLLGQRRRKGDE